MIAGLHVPLIPLSETFDRNGTASPAQIVSVDPILNTGVIFGLTVTVNVADAVVHCPAVGVKVYTPEAWLSTTAGLHVPLIPLRETPGNTGTPEPAHIVNDAPKLNVGGWIEFTVTVNVAVVAHNPASGVKV
jgi:hypothetical protein